MSRSTIWAAAAAALVVHGAMLGTVGAFGSDLVGGGFTTNAQRKAAPEIEDVDLQTSCAGDVLLATSARIAMCVSPWRADAAACGDDIEMTMWMDLSACRARNDSIAAVTMVDRRQADKVPPIDPEQLIEELQQLQKPPPPPPPVPPPQPQQQQPPPPPPPPPPQTRPSQVVEVVKPNEDKEPENARFLSEHNVKVEKQTVARGARNEPMVAKSKPEELTAKKDPPKEDPSVIKPPDKDPGKNDKAPELPGKLSMRQPGAPAASQEAPQDQKTRGAQGGNKDPIVSDGFIPRRGDHAVEQQRRDPGELTKGQNGAGGGAPPIPDLKPTKEVLERALGGGSVDHLEQIDSGEETALSAKRWVYASFFNRLKRSVAQQWDPQTVWRRSDPDGTHHGFKTRITEVRVSLNGKGDLSKIVVTTPCGVTELDDEAVRAFHAAAPFPNPPDGLVQKDNLITFAFSFYFEIGGPRTSWRVIRSQ